MRWFFSPFTIYGYTFAVIFLSVIPSPLLPQAPFLFFDQVVHFFIYLVLAFIVLNTVLRKYTHIRGAGMVSFTYAFFLGCIVELIQFFLPYRDFQYADLIANFFGSGLGAMLPITKRFHP